MTNLKYLMLVMGIILLLTSCTQRLKTINSNCPELQPIHLIDYNDTLDTIKYEVYSDVDG